MIQHLGKKLAKENRDLMLEKEYNDFMFSAGVKEPPPYSLFKEKLMLKIERPSQHSVLGT